jgi:ABC-type transport system involved in multi-copper enzyme maturation permease subunit
MMILQTITPGYNVPAVLIVAGVASFFYTEINYGTLRNQIVSGYSRKEIYTAYWIGMQIYMLIMLAIYALSISLLSSILLPNGFTNENVGPFFLSLLLGIVYEMAITSLAFFLIILIKFPAWPIVIIVMASVASMIISLVLVANNLAGQKPNLNVFYVLPWMPDIQAAILQSGDLSVVTTSSGFSMFGAVTSKTMEQATGADHVDYTAYSTFAILAESLLIALGSFLGGFFYFNHHDLK